MPYSSFKHSRQTSIRAKAQFFHFREYAVAGGMVSYGVSLAGEYRQFERWENSQRRQVGGLPVHQAAKLRSAAPVSASRVLRQTWASIKQKGSIPAE
jgi:hypothetical protein